MIHPSLPPLACLSLLAAACASPPAATVPVAGRDAQLELNLASGAYRCEDGVLVRLEREVLDRSNRRIELVWNGRRYRLERNLSYSGLPRFEDSVSGLVWIDLPWKGVLLDGRTGRPLANECRAA